jgi:uncharacterized membrane protein YbhN (UPF0104 family)
MLRVLQSWPVRLVVTGAILAWLTRSMDMSAAWAALAGTHPAWFAGALALVALDRLVMAWRWLLLLRSSGAAIGGGSALRIFLVSSFVGSFLPAGVGADAARAYSLAARTAQGSEAVASVAVDRVLGLVATVVLGVAGVLAWAAHLAPGLRQGAVLLALMAGTGSALVLWADRWLPLFVPASARGSRWVSRGVRLGNAIGRYRGRHGVMSAVFVLSLAVQLLRVLQAYGLGRGLAIDLGVGYYLVFMPIALIVLLLPVSISGFGLPQGVIVGLLDPVGVPRPASFALSTLIVVIALLGNLPGAVLYLHRREAGQNVGG